MTFETKIESSTQSNTNFYAFTLTPPPPAAPPLPIYSRDTCQTGKCFMFHYQQSFGGSTAVCASGDADTSENSCLVTIGKLQPTSIPQSSDLLDSPPVTEFISRHSLDGKFTFVDQR